MELIRNFAVTFLSFLVLDAAWLAKIAPSFYKKHIGHLMAKSPNLPVAGIFYLIYIFGLVYFVVSPALKDNMSLGQVAIRGAIIGLVCYATYDLTNHATLKDWPAIVSIVDIIWGTFLTSVTTVVAVFIITKFF